MSVGDVSGKAIANLATDDLSHPAPVFHGDTLFVESEVLDVKESKSKPDRGVVRVHTRVLNQDGDAGGGVQAQRAGAAQNARRRQRWAARAPRLAMARTRLDTLSGTAVQAPGVGPDSHV